MFEYFRGWRRKLGILMLLFAGAFMIGWLRSHYRVDLVFFTSPHHRWALISGGDSFQVVEGVSKTTLEPYTLSPKPVNATIYVNDNNGSPYPIGWPMRITRNSPKINAVKKTVTSEETISMIHYGWFAIPLTLLSAWLLLSKPQPRTTKPIG